MKELSNDEIIRMIDEYLEEPNSIDAMWVQALTQIRRMLTVKKEGAA